MLTREYEDVAELWVAYRKDQTNQEQFHEKSLLTEGLFACRVHRQTPDMYLKSQGREPTCSADSHPESELRCCHYQPQEQHRLRTGSKESAIMRAKHIMGRSTTATST